MYSHISILADLLQRPARRPALGHPHGLQGTYIYIYIYTHKCTYIYIYIHIRIQYSIYKYISIYIYIYTHTCIYINYVYTII